MAVTSAAPATARATIGQIVHTLRPPGSPGPAGSALGAVGDGYTSEEGGAPGDGAVVEGFYTEVVPAMSASNVSNAGAGRLPKLMSEM